MNRQYTIFFLTCGIVFLCDQMTKLLVVSKMHMYDSVPVIQGFFNITYITNQGVAFGFLANTAPEFRSVFLIAVTIIAMVLIAYFMVKQKISNMIFTLSLGLILGGAAGNLIDRVRLGAVVDFFDCYIGAYHWPAFNVADSAITIGAALLFWKMMRQRRSS